MTDAHDSTPARREWLDEWIESAMGSDYRIARSEPHPWRELAAEHQALRILELEDRVRDLEPFREMTRMLLPALRRMTIRFRQERRRRVAAERRS